MFKPATADQSLVRKLNTAVVLDILRRKAPVSRAELSSVSGLNRSTISNIINQLIEDGLVQETEFQSARVGRPGMELIFNPKGGFAIGIEIGVDFLSIILTDFTANVLWRKRIHSDPNAGQLDVIESSFRLAQEAVEIGERQGLRPLGIGLGAPGLVDIRQGKLMFAPNLKWQDVPLRLMWNQRFNLPVYVENEANAAALGEYYFGVARDINHFVYLSAGVGLGGGIMIDGKLFRGAKGYASEIGHVTLDPNGELCGCGKRGCWETLVGPRAVVQRVQHVLSAGEPSMLGSQNGGDLSKLTFEGIVEAAKAGDVVALTALQEVGHNLGLGIANLVNIFNPELIVFGGVLNLASSILLPILEDVVCENSLKVSCQDLRIAVSAHGVDACVMGAIALVLDDILREPALV